MCGVRFLRLEELIDNERQGVPLELEPQGTLFAKVRGHLVPCRVIHGWLYL